MRNNKIDTEENRKILDSYDVNAEELEDYLRREYALYVDMREQQNLTSEPYEEWKKNIQEKLNLI